MLFSFQGSKCYECGAVLRLNRRAHIKAVSLAIGVPVLIGLLGQSTTMFVVGVPVASLLLVSWVNTTDLEHV